MQYCAERGIPRQGEFLTWSKPDQDAALWWVLEQQRTCSVCGTDPDEFDPDKGGHPRAFVATVHECPGCAVIENARQRLTKAIESGKHQPGARPALRRQDVGRP